MKPAKHIQSSFFPANWWNEREMEQWRARPAMARAARAKRRCIGTTPKERAGNSLDRREQPVRIVAVSAEPFCGGEEFARSLAARLGWQYVDAAVLIERAVAHGGNRMQLQAALEGRRLHERERRAQILLLQATLGELIKDGWVVCHGIAADLLNLVAGEVRRIAVVAPYRCRRAAVEENSMLYGAEARVFLNEHDRARRRWCMYLFNSGTGLPLGYDLAVNPNEMGLDAALAATCAMIRDRRSLGADNPSSVGNFVLASSIRARLAICPETAHLDLDVEVQNDNAVLRGRVKNSEEFELVKDVLLPLLPPQSMDLSQIQVVEAAQASSEVRSWNSKSFRLPLAPRQAWTFAGLGGLALVALAGFWFSGRWLHPANSGRLNLQGVITDSTCGFSHHEALPAAECVRACVRTRGAKYVLSTRSRIFTLADQHEGEVLAGESVVATGILDAATGNLQLRSVRKVAR
ncbi:MAG: cytidylate kinase family protein [Acidobacteriota bacterium]